MRSESKLTHHLWPPHQSLLKIYPAADSQIVSALNTFENISLEILSKIVSSSKPATYVLFRQNCLKNYGQHWDLQC